MSPAETWDETIAALEADKRAIGTAAYQGRAYFWSWRYRHYMRDASPEIRRAVHGELLRLGLELCGESDRHFEVIRGLAGKR